MDTLLFTNATTYKRFCDALARRKNTENKKNIDNYNQEISELLDSLTKILNDNGVIIDKTDPNYYGVSSTSLDSDINSKINTILEKAATLKEDLLPKISEDVGYLSIIEDIEFFSTKINNRFELIKKALSVNNELVNKFPGLADVPNELHSLDPFEKIFALFSLKKESVPVQEAEQASEIISQPEEKASRDDNHLFQEVTGYKSVDDLYTKEVVSVVPAPANLLAMESPINTMDQPEIINQVDTSSADEGFLAELGIPVNTISTTNEDPITFITPKADWKEPTIPSENEEVIDLANYQEHEQVPKNSNLLEMQAPYTLTAISKELTGSEDGWQTIYDANKKVIDEWLTKNNYLQGEDFKNDPSALVGLSIYIPEELFVSKDNQSSDKNSMAKVA